MTTSTITSDASSVTLSSGGDNYNNPVTVASTVHLGGDNFGLYVQYQWTVHNLGTVDGVLFHGYYDGSLINDGRINSSNYGGSSDGILERGSGSVAVDNSGAISGLYNGIYLNSNGSVANETGGTISGATWASTSSVPSPTSRMTARSLRPTGRASTSGRPRARARSPTPASSAAAISALPKPATPPRWTIAGRSSEPAAKACC